MQSGSCAVMQLCSHAVVQLCSCAVMQLYEITLESSDIYLYGADNE